jgi:SHS2 domain-containing protein
VKIEKVPYKLIDHTADFGIHVLGHNPKNLYENAALAMFDFLTDLKTVKGQKHLELTLNGEDRPDLMVNWLRELLYMWTGRQMLVKKVDILFISETNLKARVFFDTYSPENHYIKNEIKAVTYHQIKVEKGPKEWLARIIFDV